MFSVKEIKKEARKRISGDGGNCVSLMLYLVSIITFLALLEISLYLILTKVGLEYYYDFTLLFDDVGVTVMWIMQLGAVVTILVYEINVIRRLFVDVSRGGNYVASKQYISAHLNSYIRKTLFSSMILNFIKLVAMLPGLISMYEVYYWGVVCRINELTSVGLFAFMLSIGFTIVWAGFFIRYCISLALTPYIMSLNPRTNIFDACDLSVKLMEGHHGDYLNFMFSFVIYIPTIILVYPFFVLFPYFLICYNVMIEKIMGEYRQDKMPGMIKRWKKYQ